MRKVPRKFRIATFNVNSIRSRLHIVIPWLERHRPDVLCLQETKVADNLFPAGAFQTIGYHAVFRGDKGRNGVAIISLEKPQHVFYGLDNGETSDEDRLIRSVVKGISIVNSYIPQGQKPDSPAFPYKLNWFQLLLKLFQHHYSPRQPIIWCGDLNVAPEPIDVHNPKRLLGHVCFRPEVWKAFQKVKDWGFIDIFRKHHPDELNQYTFFDYRVRDAVDRGLGWRVDHILATPPLAEKSVACWIDLAPRTAAKPSDHTPLVAEFEIPDRRE